MKLFIFSITIIITTILFCGCWETKQMQSNCSCERGWVSCRVFASI